MRKEQIMLLYLWRVVMVVSSTDHPLSITQIKFLCVSAENGVVGLNIKEESFCINITTNTNMHGRRPQ